MRGALRMPESSAKNSGRVFWQRLEIAAAVIFLFWLLAYGVSLIHSKYFQLGFLGFSFVGILTLAGPFVGFLLYFPTTFFLGIPLPGIPLSLNQIMGILFVISWTSWLARGKAVLEKSRHTFFLSVLVIYFVINCFFAEDLDSGLYHLRYLLIDFFLAVAIASMLRKQSHFHFLFWIILIFTLGSALLGAFELVTGIDVFTKSGTKWMGRLRINGAAPNAIVYAHQLTFSLPLGYYLFCEAKSFSIRFFALAISIFITLIALFTFNRQTIIIVLILYFLIALVYKNRYSKILLGMIISILLISSPIVVHQMWSRLRTIGSIKRDRSLAFRLDGIQVGLEVLRRKPLMGIGLGSYPTTWHKYLPPGKGRQIQYFKGEKIYPDLCYNQLISEGGIIGFSLAILFFFSLLIRVWRMRQEALQGKQREVINLYSALLTSLIIFLFSCAIQDTFLYVSTWVMFGLILAKQQIGARRDVDDKTESAVTNP